MNNYLFVYVYLSTYRYTNNLCPKEKEKKNSYSSQYILPFNIISFLAFQLIIIFPSPYISDSIQLEFPVKTNNDNSLQT